MGGIPFQSTGCNTCRRRKVKCDEAKPECFRCVKNGHFCAGYGRPRVFIHKSSNAMKDGAQKFTRRPKALLDGPRTHQVDQAGPGIPQLNTNVEVRSQLFQSFIDRYLPQSQYICDRTGKNILQTLPDLSGSSLLLDKAVVALSTAFLAKQNQDRHLLQSSTEIYGDAIRMLHGKISSGRTLGNDILYTTIIFQIYELINCSPPGFGAWIAHVQGSSAIINHCSGPGDETAASRLFRRQLKFVTLCDAIGKRKAPDLYNPWQDSSLQDTDSPEPIDELIDRLADCSVLMEQVDSLLLEGAEGHDQIQNTGRELLFSCFSLEETLHRICCMTQKELGKPSVSPAHMTCRKDFRSSLFTELLPVPFHFPSLTCAEAHLIYWTALVLLYPLIDQLLEVLELSADHVSLANCYSTFGEDANSRVTPNSEITADFTTLAEHYADQVCRSVIYCLQPDLKTLGAQLLLAPLSQSAQFYSVHEFAEKYRWCQGVFVLLPQLGLGIGYFLKDMVWPKYRFSQRRCLSPKPISPN
ncbi:hypothetical protein ANOM_004345 [Aspergillus nomiae NRRL 13137]|uniref:Zn(2)-C6 fungal-type domain-containing protein n=1 Tax=Aspergillus nomiae NRRL (strain ATCC 15546 / NRRL 13137 / CBS 260.88 / M93) TaxID=1509407 RepID=A0A0L1J8E1_ASPN3|nr:uncharacterized protein ANOM_004345 [Aspergillus nomiae NRRL 13137]KNG87940.1 hypothetical protein ANOM_004345 [Aspergillus nomiae NRRL 13137]